MESVTVNRLSTATTQYCPRQSVGGNYWNTGFRNDRRITYLDDGCNSCIVGSCTITFTYLDNGIVGSRTITFNILRGSRGRDPREKGAGQPRAAVT